MSNNVFRILSLDGGGARGLFIASTLRKIEEKYEIKFHEYFDLIVGTSTGSIIASALALGVNIKIIEKMYIEEMEKIFKKDILKNGIIQSKYDNKYLRELLETAFKNKTFENAETELMITTTNIVNGEAVILTNRNCYDIKLIDAILSSCAAPIFFDPLKIDEERIFADGGLWANNPSLTAISEVLSDTEHKKELKDIKILSIGTGEERMINKFDAKQWGWGIANWANPLIKIIFQLGSKSVHNVVNKLLSEENYIRLDYETNSILEIDVADKDTDEKAKNTIEENKEKLGKFFSDKERNKEIVKKQNFFHKIFKKKKKK
ncbi:CBASS cGAMP-activated phospholipase [Leptotrichia sp. OH3620_COT-345]|uniref:CBASS cGAMP-activated phospholipase n=1 Tax=Leptotrichia sp. OH3620_COT-345 TaxID=2491048 RepID=UPI0013157891|nr:CBASS cGAMP-activated phospholipase [Leptotrichia sp. OH3620_COT-345]